MDPFPRPGLAPVPDRRIAAPGGPDARASAPTLRPDVIGPRATPGGSATLRDEDLANRSDGLFRDPALGATLRVPFSTR